MSFVIRRRRLTSLELLNGGSLEEDLPKFKPPSFFPEPVKIPLTSKVSRTRKGRKEKESFDDFSNEVASAQPLPNMQRHFCSEGKVVHTV